MAVNNSRPRRVPAGRWWPLADAEAARDVLPLVPPRAIGIAGWLVVLALATLGMLLLRQRLNEAHVALVYLLVVLGSSAYAGRTFGLLVAGIAFMLFDWFFLPPYGTLIIANPLDWLVLVAFLGTSVVAAQLLYRAQAQASAAQARSAEIDRLAILGAETLNAGRAQDSLPAIADVIRTTLGVEWCEVYVRAAETGRTVLGARSPTRPDSSAGPALTEGQLVQWVAEHNADAVELEDGTSRVAAADSSAGGVSTTPADTHEWPALDASSHEVPVIAMYLPLRVRDRVVGVLGIGMSPAYRFSLSRRRVLRALSYYAALSVERVRLVRDAEHTAALREAAKLKDAVLASVSHDLRTPLTTIKAVANDLAASGDVRAMTIEREADRLNRFVDNLLDLSRIQAGGVSQPPMPNEAEDLVGAALQRVSGLAAGRPVQTIVQSDGDTALMGRFDFMDTLRALVNLLDNALKYSSVTSPVELTVWRDGPWLAFAVADRGPGVADLERDRIFEPFYRPRRSPLDVGGAGLGLSIARSLATAQGGSVTYEPRLGGGSVFTLRVPALDAPTEHADEMALTS
jgi:two-component system sensor histidine kinase KdpD